jgi:hypothetical protein
MRCHQPPPVASCPITSCRGTVAHVLMKRPIWGWALVADRATLQQKDGSLPLLHPALTAVAFYCLFPPYAAGKQGVPRFCLVPRAAAGPCPSVMAALPPAASGSKQQQSVRDRTQRLRGLHGELQQA